MSCNQLVLNFNYVMYLHEKCTTLKIIIVSSSSSVQHVCRLFGLIPIKPCGSLPLWTRIRVEKRKVAHLLNKFSVSYGTRRFITVYTRPLYVPCSRLNRYSERCNEIRLYFNLPQKKIQNLNCLNFVKFEFAQFYINPRVLQVRAENLWHAC